MTPKGNKWRIRRACHRALPKTQAGPKGYQSLLSTQGAGGRQVVPTRITTTVVIVYRKPDFVFRYSKVGRDMPAVKVGSSESLFLSESRPPLWNGTRHQPPTADVRPNHPVLMLRKLAAIHSAPVQSVSLPQYDDGAQGVSPWRRFARIMNPNRRFAGNLTWPRAGSRPSLRISPASVRVPVPPARSFPNSWRVTNTRFHSTLDAGCDQAYV